MTPRTLQAFRDFDSVVARLSESLSLPTNGIVRDSAILRVQLADEAGWKWVQAFLREEGVGAASQRQAFAGAFRPPFFERLPTYRDPFIQLVETLRPRTHPD